MTLKIKTVARKVGLVALLGAPLLSLPAQGHDIWVTAEKKGDQRIAIVHFGDPDKRELAELKKIVTIDLVTAGKATDLRKALAVADRKGAPVYETAAFTATAGGVVTVSYDNGFWLTRPNDQKETNTSLLMEPKGLDPHWTVKYGKMLLGPGSSEQVVQARGELIALKDPFKLKVGEKLPVKLVIDGKPIAGTRIRYSDGIEALAAEKIPFAKTDKDGVAEIPLERKGPYMIATDPTVPPSHAALSTGDHVYVALSFDLNQ